MVGKSGISDAIAIGGLELEEFELEIPNRARLDALARALECHFGYITILHPRKPLIRVRKASGAQASQLAV